MSTLYFSRNYNPRLAVAVGRYVGAPVTYEFASTFHPDHSERFRALNPTRLLPILVEDDVALWEADAIACRLSQMVGSDFWRAGDRLPDMIRWISWGHANFVRACDQVHFERVTKRRYGLGPVRADIVAEGLEGFERSAAQLDAHLSGRDWLLDDGVSYTDFRAACVLPYAGIAGLTLDGFPNVAAWNRRLNAIAAWRDPFEGLSAPELPPVRDGG